MKIKTSTILYGVIVLIALSQGENVRQSLEKGNEVREQQASFSDRIRQNRTEARQAEKLSKVAIDRYKNHCIFVVDEGTGKEDYFQPGVSVMDTQLARTLRPGAFICNRLGDTAVVSQAGTITDIARVSTTDLPQFNKLLEARK